MQQSSGSLAGMAASSVQIWPCAGTTKKLRFSWPEYTAGSRRDVDETLEVQVKPGWKAGTRITYPGKGTSLSSLSCIQGSGLL